MGKFKLYKTAKNNTDLQTFWADLKKSADRLMRRDSTVIPGTKVSPELGAAGAYAPDTPPMQTVPAVPTTPELSTAGSYPADASPVIPDKKTPKGEGTTKEADTSTDESKPQDQTENAAASFMDNFKKDPLRTLGAWGINNPELAAAIIGVPLLALTDPFNIFGRRDRNAGVNVGGLLASLGIPALVYAGLRKAPDWIANREVEKLRGKKEYAKGANDPLLQTAIDAHGMFNIRGNKDKLDAVTPTFNALTKVWEGTDRQTQMNSTTDRLAGRADSENNLIYPDTVNNLNKALSGIPGTDKARSYMNKYIKLTELADKDPAKAQQLLADFVPENKRFGFSRLSPQNKYQVLKSILMNPELHNQDNNAIYSLIVKNIQNNPEYVDNLLRKIYRIK